MKIRIFLTIFVFIMLCTTARAARKYDVERGNDKKHINAARQISALEGVDTAAVLSYDGRVLVGITLISEADKGYVCGWAEEMLKSSFPRAKKLRIFTDDENARNVVELSLCLETDMKKKLLMQRFDFLIGQNI